MPQTILGDFFMIIMIYFYNDYKWYQFSRYIVKILIVAPYQNKGMLSYPKLSVRPLKLCGHVVVRLLIIISFLTPCLYFKKAANVANRTKNTFYD